MKASPSSGSIATGTIRSVRAQHAPAAHHRRARVIIDDYYYGWVARATHDSSRAAARPIAFAPWANLSAPGREEGANRYAEALAKGDIPRMNGTHTLLIALMSDEFAGWRETGD